MASLPTFQHSVAHSLTHSLHKRHCRASTLGLPNAYPYATQCVLGFGVQGSSKPASCNECAPGPARNRSVFRQMCQIPCAVALDMYFKPNARYMMQRRRRRHYCFWPKAVVARRRRGATLILGGTVNQIFDRTWMHEPLCTNEPQRANRLALARCVRVRRWVWLEFRVCKTGPGMMVLFTILLDALLWFLIERAFL